MNTSLASKRGSVRARAEKFAAVRSFFAERGVLEADTNVLSAAAPIDVHIEVMQVDRGGEKIGYLHTSPEYELKKLLASGSGDIYQLSHVFRAKEEGPLHSEEFMMLEWYRIGMEYHAFIEETIDLIRLFVGNIPYEILSYRTALYKYAGIDYRTQNLESFLKPFSPDAKEWDRDTQLSLLFSHLVESHLGKETLMVITDYPATQAALAKTTEKEGEIVARRFEIYYQGIELANGFDELTNGEEQRKRLLQENQKRLALGKGELPIDEEFLSALDFLPECCGVAVGFDRLMLFPSLNDRESAANTERNFTHTD